MLIEFSDFNLKILILLIFPIFKTVQDYSKKAYVVEDNYIFKTFRYFASYIFGVIPLLIIKYRSKNDHKPIYKTKNDSIEEVDNMTEDDLSSGKENTMNITKKFERKYQNIIFLGILCIISIFCYFYRKFFEKDQFRNAKQSIGVFCEIVDFVLSSYIILKQKLYKHHFIFAGIIALVLLILFCISIPYLESEYILTSCIYYLFYSLCFGFYDVFGKKYMIKFFITPYFLMFLIGIINTTLLLIFDSFAYFFNQEISGVIIGLQNNIQSVGDIFMFILDLFLNSMWNHGIWLTIYYFTPCHYFISEYISEFIYYLIAAVGKKEGFYSTVNIIIFSISYFINFVCVLFFNEVLILNIFKLDYNTKKRIIERLELENEENYQENKLMEMEEENGENEEFANRDNL